MNLALQPPFDTANALKVNVWQGDGKSYQLVERLISFFSRENLFELKHTGMRIIRERIQCIFI